MAHAGDIPSKSHAGPGPSPPAFGTGATGREETPWRWPPGTLGGNRHATIGALDSSLDSFTGEPTLSCDSRNIRLLLFAHPASLKPAVFSADKSQDVLSCPAAEGSSAAEDIQPLDQAKGFGLDVRFGFYVSGEPMAKQEALESQWPDILASPCFLLLLAYPRRFPLNVATWLLARSSCD